MSFFKNLMRKFRGESQKQMLTEILSDSRAVFASPFGNNIYASDFINNCIARIATEISKIEVVSVIERDNSIQRLNDDITRLFSDGVNELQTAKDFLACCCWLLRKKMNCFIYPQFELVKSASGQEFRRYVAFYPLNPISAELGHFADDASRWAIKFHWQDGSADVLPYEAVIHLKWRRGVSTLIGGGNDYGAADESNVMRSLTALDQIIQGVPKLIESGLNLRGVLSVKTVIDQKSLTKAAADFESRIVKSDNGIVAIGLDGQFTPINSAMPVIPDSTLKFLKDIIRERYGVSEAILSGDFTGETHAAFYQTCVEEFIIEFEQAMTQRLFTARERSLGHRIKGYYSKVAYFSAKDKMELATLATNSGLMTLNELRELYGYPPLPDGNRRLQSLNFVSADLADNYQLQSDEKNKFPKADFFAIMRGRGFALWLFCGWLAIICICSGILSLTLPTNAKSIIRLQRTMFCSTAQESKCEKI